MSSNERSPAPPHLPVACASPCQVPSQDPPRAAAKGAPPSEGAWRRIGAARDVPPRGMKSFLAGDTAVLVIDLGDQLVAVQSFCPHEAVPLEMGAVEGRTLTCLEHMWQFDLTSGAPLGEEATEGLQTFPLRNLDGDLYVAVE